MMHDVARGHDEMRGYDTPTLIYDIPSQQRPFSPVLITSRYMISDPNNNYFPQLPNDDHYFELLDTPYSLTVLLRQSYSIQYLH